MKYETSAELANDGAKVIQVIETVLLIRGNGDTIPLRRITQYWSLDGKLLAEVDPWTPGNGDEPFKQMQEAK